MNMAGTGRIESDDSNRWSSFDGGSSQASDGAAACVDNGTPPRDEAAPYGDAGTTPTGDGVFAGAAMLKGRDARTGIGVEVMSVSGQVGAQNEVSLVEARLTTPKIPTSVTGTVDVLTAHLGAGTRNADGSRGLNVGATAIGVGAEATIEGSGWSFTAGASLGVGGEASIGLRDADQDGHAEICVRAVFSWWTLGGCAELPFESRALAPGGKGE
jgi:hypothetical protein